MHHIRLLHCTLEKPVGKGVYCNGQYEKGRQEKPFDWKQLTLHGSYIMHSVEGFDWLHPVVTDI